VGVRGILHSLHERIGEMQTAKQLSVSLANKPGRLADVLAAFNKMKVSFRALAVMDSGDRGTVRFVPDDFDEATSVLEKLNVPFDSADVLLVEIPTQPGGFGRICKRLADEHLNIDYAYCSFSGEKSRGGALAVIRVNDLAKAQRVLAENGTMRKKMPFRRPVLVH
jgi:hypothetical protein